MSSSAQLEKLHSFFLRLHLLPFCIVPTPDWNEVSHTYECLRVGNSNILSISQEMVEISGEL